MNKIIKIAKLIYEYTKYGEEGDVVGKTRAIDDVSLEIEKGDFVAILGHNGSGKSTLAKHLNAIFLPTEGTVWLGEMDTKDTDHIWDIRQRAGMVFQNPDNQIIANVVEEDVAFGPENLCVPSMEIWERVEKSLKAVGMTAYRRQSPNKLSGGQKQRVAIAGVVAMKPDCIIMDDGKLVMDGTPREIFSHVEKLKSYRLDVPQMTELAYELKKEGLPLRDGILTVQELVDELCQYV